MEYILYIYDVDTKKIEAEITGKSNEECEKIASDIYGDTDRWAWSYNHESLID